METSSLSAFFIMFDFAMPLNHKRVHNFFGWSFLHCTALPILIFDNGRVHLSNEHAEEEEDCLVIFAWGREGGKAESRLNKNMKDSESNKKDTEERDSLCNLVVERLSRM